MKKIDYFTILAFLIVIAYAASEHIKKNEYKEVSKVFHKMAMDSIVEEVKTDERNNRLSLALLYSVHGTNKRELDSLLVIIGEEN